MQRERTHKLNKVWERTLKKYKNYHQNQGIQELVDCKQGVLWHRNFQPHDGNIRRQNGRISLAIASEFQFSRNMLETMDFHELMNGASVCHPGLSIAN